MWINSTFGLLLILINRQETRSAWIRLKMSHWRLQNILNITELDRVTIDKLSSIFDRYADKKMSRLPQQYNPKAIDSTRLAFDKEVLKSLGVEVSQGDLIAIYKMIYESFDEWFDIGENQIEERKNENFNNF